MLHETVNKLIVILCVVITIAKGQDSQCAKGWVHHDESCYMLHTKDKYNWIESQMLCSGHGAHLAYIDDNAENIFVKGLIMQNLTGQGGAHVWIGASDDAYEGDFLWYGIDQPLTFTDWGPGEPNSVRLHLDEDCLVYWSNYHWKWADYNCHAQCYYVCEKSVEDSSVIVG
ncbi:perlucin-like protein [Mercenaria mercenaria]|uniref:perlucin-like protein n=1 Tax=Mercenaria mercenaria TaxID=6596 RepID=UPI00234FB4AD|nr:perlucin-like protein [Mercenaria mercenaria]